MSRLNRAANIVATLAVSVVVLLWFVVAAFLWRIFFDWLER